jgi:hypothetical protein
VVVATVFVDEGFDGALRVRLGRLAPVEEVRLEHVKAATLRIRPPGGREARPGDYQEAIQGLARLFDEHHGDTDVKVVVDYGDSQVVLALAGRQVELKDSFLHGLGLLSLAATDVSFQLYAAGSGAGSGA